MNKLSGQVRFGIIGIGAMGGKHAQNLKDGLVKDAVLAAVCDLDPQKREFAKANLGVPAFEAAEDMFKSGLIDAALIATPHYYHPPLAVKAFESGINVLCEKPAGVYTQQAREMNEAAGKSGLAFGMMFNQRTNCVYRKMRELVQGGELGELKRSNWIITDWYRSQAYYNSGGWRATWGGEGGGVLLNQSPHNLDLWQWICGMPKRVTAFMGEGKWHDIEVEDDVTAYVEYENGATGVFITATADYPGTNRFEVTGDKGKLVCEGGKLTFWKGKTGEREFNGANTVPFGKPDMDVIEVETDGQNPQHNGVLAAYTAHLLHGEPLVARGEEGIRSLTLSNAMYLSAWLGKTVELPLDEALFYEKLQEKIAAAKGK